MNKLLFRKIIFNRTLHAFSVFSFAFILYLMLDAKILSDIYSKFQTALFTGFLTIGGFLLSLKTFILVKMREDLYDSDSYKKRFEQKKNLDSSLKLYSPLRRLGDYLVYCVICALLTAFMQISIGFINHGLAAAVCIAAALFTMCLVIFAWWQIKLILNDWFDILETED